jgi:signal peptidase I
MPLNGELPTPEPQTTSAFRHLVEALLLLAVSVLIFRTFAAEGYLISTGSMAPCLLGYHRQVTCPTCSHQFAKGMSIAEAEGSTSITSTASASVGDPHGISGTACPNCGRTGLTVNGLPKNEGDQLLVNKHAFMLRTPHRWEVIVFRNPSDPLEAYVKRAVGLPGETIELRDGEVFANGVQQRKSLTAQLGTRILVDEHAHQPDPENEDWGPRWSAEQDETCWSETPAGFDFSGSGGSTAPLDWLEFRHWIVSGGSHQTQIPLAQWPKSLVKPSSEFSSLDYDSEKRLLSCQGALPAEERDRWINRTTDADFHHAINKLYIRSHFAPISDEYGYNQRYEGVTNYRVPDVMLEFDLDQVPSAGELTTRLAHGRTQVDCVFDFSSRTMSVRFNTLPKIEATVPLPRSLNSGSHQITTSVFDGQLVVGIDEQPLGEPIFLPESAEGPPAPWVERVARIAAKGAAVSVRNIRLYRDVYYTPKNEAGGKQFQLAADEYFALGDNSPVSVDSRCWESPGVPERSLIGKPFVVHLPSRPGRIALGGKVTYVRVPDFSRVRYIR